ncbi:MULTISPECIES: hypothetical protein [Halorussus]|uniref:hypothetical protein n=1 Tax=Halorussus TaxID=1070314 RepID=UPI00209CBB83|nr:hypothetical protein [Halorussus vallis]USZ78180.1 hypothetical protein NGM07_21220 [Halorussus vallis]
MTWRNTEYAMYGPPQHEVGALVDLHFRYGEPNHDPEPSDPQAAERLGYEDDEPWDDGDGAGGHPSADGGVRDGDRTGSPKLLA